jgi:hypothetical protein
MRSNVSSDTHTFYDAKADMVHPSTFHDCGSYHSAQVANHTTHPETDAFDIHG